MYRRNSVAKRADQCNDVRTKPRQIYHVSIIKNKNVS